jgi:hypothetical protein
MKTSYRKYYLKQSWLQFLMALTLFWHGVLLNKGHHSRWNEKKKKKSYNSMT